MLLLICFHIFITAICSLTGFLFYFFILKKEEAKGKPLIFYPVTGLIVTTLISQLAVLFIPIDKYFFLSFCVFIFLLFIIKRNRIIPFYKNAFTNLRKRSVISILLISAGWLTILVLNAGPTMMDDTESYHIQMIKWIKEYGTVPGIVNLHERFGFNSSWFSSISFFLPGSGNLNFYTTLNGVISLWLFSFLVGQFSHTLSLRNKQEISAIDIAIFLVFVLSFFCWPMMRGNATTSNYDFIATVLIIILFVKGLRSDSEKARFALEWIIWPVYLFTVRIINYPLLLLSLYGLFSLIKNKEWQRLILSLVISLCLVIPFMARNIILSGYPFYPATIFNIFSVDWKADSHATKELVDFIKYYNRVNVPFMSIDETKQLSFPDWAFAWFRHMFAYNKPVVIAGLSGFLLSFILLKRFLKIFNPSTRFFVLCLCLQFISWFWTAPDPRFVYGGLLCGSMLLVIFLLNNKNYRIPGIKVAYILIIPLAGMLLYITLKVKRNKNYQNFLAPYHLPQPPTNKIIVSNISFKIPEKIMGNWNPRCYATDLPCLYIINPRLRARGKDIKDGFRLEK
jgi:hypothetical protein